MGGVVSCLVEGVALLITTIVPLYHRSVIFALYHREAVIVLCGTRQEEVAWV